MNANEKRAAVVRKYEEILGRNRYSQQKRAYAYKKYKDGKYYSDCSSSVALAYKEAGHPVRDNAGGTCPNTVGMYLADALADVPARIENGLILNPEILRPGDMLLFAGADSARAHADCVGHVEMVGKIEGSRVTLYGHGSGTPRATEMNAYCKSRRAKKTNTKIGSRRLLKVRRLIPDDNEPGSANSGTSGTGGNNPAAPGSAASPDFPEEGWVLVTGGRVNLRTGPGTAHPSVCIARRGESYALADLTRWLPVDTGSRILWISRAYASLSEGRVRVTGGSVNLRRGPGTAHAVAAVARRGESYALADLAGWLPVDTGSRILWISRSYARPEAQP